MLNVEMITALKADIEQGHRRVFELESLLPVFNGDASDNAEKVDRFHEINNQILREGNNILQLHDQLDRLFASTPLASFPARFQVFHTVSNSSAHSNDDGDAYV